MNTPRECMTYGCSNIVPVNFNDDRRKCDQCCSTKKAGARNKNHLCVTCGEPTKVREGLCRACRQKGTFEILLTDPPVHYLTPDERAARRMLARDLVAIKAITEAQSRELYPREWEEIDGGAL